MHKIRQSENALKYPDAESQKEKLTSLKKLWLMQKMLGVTVIFHIPTKAAICSQALIIIKTIFSFSRKFAAVNPVSLLPLSLVISLEHYSELKLEEYLL